MECPRWFARTTTSLSETTTFFLFLLGVITFLFSGILRLVPRHSDYFTIVWHVVFK